MNGLSYERKSLSYQQPSMSLRSKESDSAAGSTVIVIKIRGGYGIRYDKS